MALLKWGVKLFKERPQLALAMQGVDYSRIHEALRGSGMVFFGRAKSAAKVNEFVRKATHELFMNDEAFCVWGFFIFMGDPQEIAKIKKVL
jgi:hypothetical protein